MEKKNITKKDILLITFSLFNHNFYFNSFILKENKSTEKFKSKYLNNLILNYFRIKKKLLFSNNNAKFQ